MGLDNYEYLTGFRSSQNPVSYTLIRLDSKQMAEGCRPYALRVHCPVRHDSTKNKFSASGTKISSGDMYLK
jgi:hypothetical protein